MTDVKGTFAFGKWRSLREGPFIAEDCRRDPIADRSGKNALAVRNSFHLQILPVLFSALEREGAGVVLVIVTGEPE